MDIEELLGQTDIYLIDQIMKGRYQKDERILDAGCGGGRNLHWFLKNNLTVFGIDINTSAILGLKEKNADIPSDRFQVAGLHATPFDDQFFDHILVSAVLHFAESTAHFFSMVTELTRILKPGGSLFIRMASDIGIEDKVKRIGDGVYAIPDGSRRFLLTRSLLSQLMEKFPLEFIEPFKTVNVEDIRCMSTLVLRKL